MHFEKRNQLEITRSFPLSGREHRQFLILRHAPAPVLPMPTAPLTNPAVRHPEVVLCALATSHLHPRVLSQRPHPALAQLLEAQKFAPLILKTSAATAFQRI